MAGSADRLIDDGSDRLVPQRAGPLTRAFDHGVDLLIGQRLERAIDLFEARARGQEEGEDLLRQRLALSLREGLNLRLWALVFFAGRSGCRKERGRIMRIARELKTIWFGRAEGQRLEKARDLTPLAAPPSEDGWASDGAPRCGGPPPESTMAIRGPVERQRASVPGQHSAPGW